MTQAKWRTIEQREAWLDYHPPGSLLVHYSWPIEDTSDHAFSDSSRNEQAQVDVLLLIIGTNGFFVADGNFRVILWNQLDQKLVEMTWRQLDNYVSLPEEEDECTAQT